MLIRVKTISLKRLFRAEGNEATKLHAHAQVYIGLFCAYVVRLKLIYIHDFAVNPIRVCTGCVRACLSMYERVSH